MAMQTFRFTLFMAFGIWLLYQIKQLSTKKSVTSEIFSIHLNNQRISNILGRKGRVTPLKSTHRVNSEVILYDTMNNSEPEDGDYRFLDENGIPEADREKLVGNESTRSEDWKEANRAMDEKNPRNNDIDSRELDECDEHLDNLVLEDGRDEKSDATKGPKSRNKIYHTQF
ncbi:unnamed protein product [Lactuca saligna]|uniref:Uncharacterized protein n=1 Tax=Lactuca saligna TaxID=75948 RepID=A0AA35VAX8_LACSI|nr:unnamed protein product [Lactuca saligna]